jgi:hypothetical protein
LNRTAALFGTHLMPLSAQLIAPLWRYLSKALKVLAHPLLLIGRQAFELLPALAQQLTLFRRHGAPLAEALLGAGTLLRCHREPPLAAFGQRLLLGGRQAVPVTLILLQQPLLWR